MSARCTARSAGMPTAAPIRARWDRWSRPCSLVRGEPRTCAMGGKPVRGLQGCLPDQHRSAAHAPRTAHVHRGRRRPLADPGHDRWRAAGFQCLVVADPASGCVSSGPAPGSHRTIGFTPKRKIPAPHPRPGFKGGPPPAPCRVSTVNLFETASPTEG